MLTSTYSFNASYEAKSFIKTQANSPAEDFYDLRVASFFDLEEEGAFDFIYDYTFLCALGIYSVL